MMMERSAGQSLWGAFQARLDCTFLHRTDQRRSARLLRSLTQLERRKWDLDTLIGRPSESLTLRAAQGEAHAGLTGKWRKDKSASDPMEEACDAVKLPWLLKKAVLVLNTLELEDTTEFFRTNLKAGGVLDVVECYPWTGEVVLHKRRDKRAGSHRGHVERTADGEPCICVEWDDPYGGECSDVFVLSDGGRSLTQLSDMTIRGSGQRCQYRTVFRRDR